jgi:acetolactate synthase-1/2/3 large subunit
LINQTMAHRRCADTIVESLIAHDVDTIFGLPGAQTYALFEALRQRKDQIRYIGSRHEQGAAYMAFGYAKSTGRVGAYTVVPGPGVLNTTAALCTAHSAPVLCLTGQIPVEFIGRGHGMLHELPDQLATLRTLTKWAARINHPAEAPSVMSEAFRQLHSGRAQPVAIEVPGDVLGMRGVTEAQRIESPITAFNPDPDKIDEAAELIKDARKPMIMVGSGAIDAGEEILELARMIQAPVVSFRGGRGIVSDESPFGFNCIAGNKLWPDTDLMIGIGSRLELPAFHWQKGRPSNTLIRIDIDPTQMFRLRANVDIVGDAKVASRELVDSLAKRAAAVPSREEEFERVKAQVTEEIQQVQPQMAYLDVIRDVLPRDGFLVEEISQVGFTSWYGFPIYAPRKLVTSGYQGNLGHGFQTALGVKVGNPDSAVVSLSGDGGFMFGVQELATAVQHRINLVTIIFNNNAYGNVRRDQIDLYDGHTYGADLRNPDFVKLAESFGAQAYRATTPDKLQRVLETGLSLDEPAIIEVPCERGSEVSPLQFLMPAGFPNR